MHIEGKKNHGYISEKKSYNNINPVQSSVELIKACMTQITPQSVGIIWELLRHKMVESN